MNSAYHINGREAGDRDCSWVRPLPTWDTHNSASLLSLDAIIDPDPDPTADQWPSTKSRRLNLELPRRGEHRASDLRPLRIFGEPHTILDAIVRRGAACDQSPAWPPGGRQIRAQSVFLRLAIPGRRIKRLAIWSCSHTLGVAGGGTTSIRWPVKWPARWSWPRGVRGNSGGRWLLVRRRHDGARDRRSFRFSGLRRQWFLCCRALRHRLRRRLLGLRIAGFGRFLRNVVGAEVHHGDALLLFARRLFRAKREQ